MEISAEAVLGCEDGELGEAGHPCLVLVDHLTEDAGRGHPRRPGQVDRRFGVTGPLEHATGPIAEREDVAGPVEIRRADMRVDERLDGGGPVSGGDAGRGPVAVVDADGEGGALHLGIGGDHEGKVELLHPLGGEGNADESRGMGQKEGDLLRGGGVGRHDQVALVLAVLVVDHDHDLAPSDRRNGVLYC